MIWLVGIAGRNGGLELGASGPYTAEAAKPAAATFFRDGDWEVLYSFDRRPDLDRVAATIADGRAVSGLRGFGWRYP